MKKKAILFAAFAIIFSTFFVLGEASESSSVPTLIETTLVSVSVSSMANLDLIPMPANESSASAYANLNLDPRNVVFNSGRVNFRPEIGVSTVGDALFNASIWSIVALNVADYFSTKEALKYPGLQEGNPLMKSIVKNPLAFAAVKIGFSAFAYFNMKSIYKKNKPLAWVLSVASNLALSYVVSNNIGFINRAKGR